jgi:hypothetical protein
MNNNMADLKWGGSALALALGMGEFQLAQYPAERAVR